MSQPNNSLTNQLDREFPDRESLEEFIDNLEDEIFGLTSQQFYKKYKGDTKKNDGLQKR